MNVFLVITKDGDHHYIIATDHAQAFTKLQSLRPEVASKAIVVQKMNEQFPVLGL